MINQQNTYNYIPSEFFEQGYILHDDGQVGFITCQRWQWWCCTDADIFRVRKNLYHILLHIPSYAISVHGTLIPFTAITFTKYDTYIHFWLAQIKITVLVLWQGGCFPAGFTGSYTQSQSRDILQLYLQWLILIIKTRNSSLYMGLFWMYIEPFRMYWNTF